MTFTSLSSTLPFMNEETTNLKGVEGFAPKAESYLPTPKFRFAPNQREIDFAQIVASGGDMVEALTIASLVTTEERANATREQLYAMGTRLLSSPAIQERIDYYLVLHKASMSVSVERIQQELAANAFSDPAGLFHQDDGPLVSKPKLFPSESEIALGDTNETVPEYLAGDPIQNIHHVPRHVRAAIKEWGFDKDGVLKAKFHDKLKATRMLGDLEGHFDEANRAKAVQVSISIGDGQGMKNITQAPAAEDDIIEVEQPDTPDCLL